MNKFKIGDVVVVNKNVISQWKGWIGQTGKICELPDAVCNCYGTTIGNGFRTYFLEKDLDLVNPIMENNKSIRIPSSIETKTVVEEKYEGEYVEVSRKDLEIIIKGLWILPMSVECGGILHKWKDYLEKSNVK